MTTSQALPRLSSVPNLNDVSPAYELDLYAWSLRQAQLLREERFAECDLAHVAEEIDGVGRSQRAELRSRARTLVEHLLKLEHATSLDPRRGWRETVRRTRLEVDDILSGSPSLRRELAEILAEVQPSARALAAALLDDHDEHKAAGRVRGQPGEYSGDHVFGSWLPEGPGNEHT